MKDASPCWVCGWSDTPDSANRTDAPAGAAKAKPQNILKTIVISILFGIAVVYALVMALVIVCTTALSTIIVKESL